MRSYYLIDLTIMVIIINPITLTSNAMGLIVTFLVSPELPTVPTDDSEDYCASIKNILMFNLTVERLHLSSFPCAKGCSSLIFYHNNHLFQNNDPLNVPL